MLHSRVSGLRSSCECCAHCACSGHARLTIPPPSRAHCGCQTVWLAAAVVPEPHSQGCAGPPQSRRAKRRWGRPGGMTSGGTSLPWRPTWGPLSSTAPRSAGFCAVLVLPRSMTRQRHSLKIPSTLLNLQPSWQRSTQPLCAAPMCCLVILCCSLPPNATQLLLGLSVLALLQGPHASWHSDDAGQVSRSLRLARPAGL